MFRNTSFSLIDLPPSGVNALAGMNNQSGTMKRLEDRERRPFSGSKGERKNYHWFNDRRLSSTETNPTQIGLAAGVIPVVLAGSITEGIDDQARVISEDLHAGFRFTFE